MPQPEKKEPGFGLDTSIFTQVIENGSADHRLTLATQLAEFLNKDGVPKSEREQVVPVVLKLAVYPVTDVRRALAEGLCGLADPHADILFSIISDEDAIAPLAMLQ